MNLDLLFVRQMLVCFSGTVYWIGVLLLAAVIRHRTGRAANLRPRGAKERALWFGWVIVIVGWIGQPLITPAIATLSLFTIMTPFYQWTALVAGTLLIVAGQLGTYWCYWAMGDSWRVGVSRQEDTRLVTQGPYALVRHPIYSFQSMMLIGAACLLPTLLSVFLIGLQWLCSYFKAMDEERHLTDSLGAEYYLYRERTGWVWPHFLAAAARDRSSG